MCSFFSSILELFSACTKMFIFYTHRTQRRESCEIAVNGLFTGVSVTNTLITKVKTRSNVATVRSIFPLCC